MYLELLLSVFLFKQFKIHIYKVVYCIQTLHNVEKKTNENSVNLYFNILFDKMKQYEKVNSRQWLLVIICINYKTKLKHA